MSCVVRGYELGYLTSMSNASATTPWARSSLEPDSTSEVVKISMEACFLLLITASLTPSDRSAILAVLVGAVVSSRYPDRGTVANIDVAVDLSVAALLWQELTTLAPCVLPLSTCSQTSM